MKKRKLRLAIYVRYWGEPMVWVVCAGALLILLWEVARPWLWWL